MFVGFEGFVRAYIVKEEGWFWSEGRGCLVKVRRGMEECVGVRQVLCKK